ncbi:hypothetical protein GCM10022285_49940 [Streptomyces tunisiensis]|uniref:Uncharacterized protein n=1 Tax=Streptomyces tunisiensis TaxID=948699 RepID=A0ABP7Z158_9ACTN
MTATRPPSPTVADCSPSRADRAVPRAPEEAPRPCLDGNPSAETRRLRPVTGWSRSSPRPLKRHPGPVAYGRPHRVGVGAGGTSAARLDWTRTPDGNPSAETRRRLRPVTG